MLCYAVLRCAVLCCGVLSAPQAIIQKFQKELWQDRRDMCFGVLEEASALYQVCYLMSEGKRLKMAWRVAARELIAICNINTVRNESSPTHD